MPLWYEMERLCIVGLVHYDKYLKKIATKQAKNKIINEEMVYQSHLHKQ